MADGIPRYKVLPLPVVQKWAKKTLSSVQLRGGIKLARALRFYPNVPELDIQRCGDGMELRIEHPSIGKQGWLRAIFWIDEKTKTIYIVDIFWKKTNAISPADKLRANQRIRGLKAALAAGKKPWH
jgi:phage-related protein